MYSQICLVRKYLEGHTKSVLRIRSTCYQYWLTCSVHELGTEWSVLTKQVAPYLDINDRQWIQGLSQYI